MLRADSVRRLGFTLLEVLIVISIIALLAGLLLPTLNLVQKKSRRAVAKTEVMTFSGALACYVEDESEYPALAKATPEENQFPALYGALWGERRPLGAGGRSAPYSRLESSRVAVLDRASGELRKASRNELEDPAIEKHLLDPFGSAYVYRPNQGRKPAPFARNRNGAVIYSLGPNEIDDTLESAHPERAEDETSDDIGNW